MYQKQDENPLEELDCINLEKRWWHHSMETGID